jgi:S-adenosylmethionine hydrolase
MSPVITLTSDWGLRDHYVASVKGAIISRLPGATIIDISHQIAPFNLKQGSFILRNAYPSFPKGTIHIVGINTEESEHTPHIALLHNGHFFIGTDNGIFTLMFDSLPEKIIELEITQDSGYFTFSTRDRFVKAAAHIAQGEPLEALGNLRTDLNALISMKSQVNGNTIAGRVVYTDNYENVFLNITLDELEEAGNKRKFTLNVKGRKYQVNQLRSAYTDVPDGEIAVIPSSTGFIEIAINRGNAASLLGLRTDDVVLIEFDN